MRDTKFRQRMNALCLEKRDMVESFIEHFRKRVNMQSPGPCTDYALAAIALMDGILYFNLTMPNELPNASAEAVLCNIFTGILSLKPP